MEDTKETPPAIIQEPEAGWSDVLGDDVANPPAPRVVGQLVFALDREFKCSPLEQRIRAQFEQWVREGAERAIAESALVDPDEAHERRATYMAERGAGRYNWPSNKKPGRAVRLAIQDLPGLEYMFYLLLARCSPEDEMTEEIAAQIIKEIGPRTMMQHVSWAMTEGNRLEALAEDKARAKAKKKKSKKPTRNGREDDEATLDGD